MADEAVLAVEPGAEAYAEARKGSRDEGASGGKRHHRQSRKHRKNSRKASSQSGAGRESGEGPRTVHEVLAAPSDATSELLSNLKDATMLEAEEADMVTNHPLASLLTNALQSEASRRKYDLSSEDVQVSLAKMLPFVSSPDDVDGVAAARIDVLVRIEAVVAKYDKSSWRIGRRGTSVSRRARVDSSLPTDRELERRESVVQYLKQIPPTSELGVREYFFGYHYVWRALAAFLSLIFALVGVLMIAVDPSASRVWGQLAMDPATRPLPSLGASPQLQVTALALPSIMWTWIGWPFLLLCFAIVIQRIRIPRSRSLVYVWYRHVGPDIMEPVTRFFGATFICQTPSGQPYVSLFVLCVAMFFRHPRPSTATDKHVTSCFLCFRYGFRPHWILLCLVTWLCTGVYVVSSVLCLIFINWAVLGTLIVFAASMTPDLLAACVDAGAGSSCIISWYILIASWIVPLLLTLSSGVVFAIWFLGYFFSSDSLDYDEEALSRHKTAASSMRVSKRVAAVKPGGEQQDM